MQLGRIVASLVLILSLCSFSFYRHTGGGSTAPVVGTIVFNQSTTSYIYPAASGSLVGPLVATISNGTPFDPGGFFTLSGDPGCSDLLVSGNSVVVGPTNLTGSGTCTISANYSGLTPVSALLTWNGTQQAITAITPSSYTFVAPAGGAGATLGNPLVTMSGGISFSAGGGTLALGVGAQCSSLTYSSPTLKTVPSLTTGTYNCSLIATDTNASNSGFTQAISAVGSGATIISVDVSDPNFQASVPNAPVGTLSCTLSTGLPCSGTYTMISSGLDNNGNTCNTSSGTQFAVSGTTLQTNSSGLSAITYSNICVQGAVVGVATPFIQAFNLVGTNSTLVGTKTFYNNASSTTPGSSFPAHWLQTFAPGDVPVGSIAVPTVALSSIQYGVDCAIGGCPTWPDGSLRSINISAFLPQLASKATVTVQFTQQSGSYDTTSTVTPATIVAAANEKTVLSDVNNSWVPEFYGQWNTPRVQIGCHVSGGSVTDCPIRTNIPSGSTYAYSCLTSGGVPAFTGFISGTTLTVTAVTSVLSGGRVGTGANTSGYVPALNPLVLKDITGSLAPGTILIKQLTGTTSGVGTYQVNISQTVSSEAMTGAPCSGAVYRGALATNGTIDNVFDINAAVFSTTLNANNFPASTTVVSGGSGYSLIGSGTMTFDPNVILNEYGSIDPPTCSAELGAGVFSANYSGGALTTTSVTSGHIAKGQIVVDSTGASAVVTGSSSPWAVSSVLTSGAMTASTPACVYAQSPTMKGYRVFGYFLDGSTPDSWHQMTAYVEMWSLAGTPFSVRVAGRSSMPWKPNNYFPSDTYDIDMKNGTAEIRGNASGDTLYSALTDEAPGMWYTLDDCPPATNPVGCSARADWVGVTPNSSTFYTTNSRAFNSVVPTLLTTDKPYWRLSRVMLPLDDNLVPSPATLPLNGVWDNPIGAQCYYEPLGASCVDTASGWGSGGQHFFLAAHSEHLAWWYLLTDHASDHGASWLQQMRVAGLGVSGTSGGFYEGATLHALNVDPTFVNAAYTDPVRYGSNLSGNFGPSANTMAVYGGQTTDVAEIGQTSHWPSGTIFAAYVADGERWQLDEMDLNAANALTNYSDTNIGIGLGQRIVTFGGHTYYGVISNDYVPRIQAWAAQLVDQTAVWGMPNEPDTKYWRQIQLTAYTQKTLSMSYTGSWSYGSPIFAHGTKLYDGSTNGTTVAPSFRNLVGAVGMVGNPPFAIGEDPWMDAYWAQVILLDQMWEDHFISYLDTFATELAYNFIIVKHAQDSCLFNANQYFSWFSAPSDGLPQTNHDSTTLLTGAHGNFFNQAANALTAVSGNPTLTTTITGYPASLVGSTIPSGSTFIPAQVNVLNGIAGDPVVAPFNDHTHYTWCSLSSTTGTLNPLGTNCSTPAPITPTASAGFTGGWILNRSCPVANNTNGIFGIAGSQGVGYIAADWPIANWWIALNGSDSNTTAAINQLSPLFAGAPGYTNIANSAWTASDHF